MAGYKLIRPCPRCPFRTDVPAYLRPERTVEISESLANGAIFPCHETTEAVEDDEGSMEAGPDSQFCAGALLMMEKMGRLNQIVRVAERLGMYDAAKLDMDAPVVRSPFEFFEHHGGSGETCCVVNAGCESPAGMMVGDFPIPAVPDGETHECPACGEHVCENCSNDDGVCENCADED